MCICFACLSFTQSTKGQMLAKLENTSLRTYFIKSIKCSVAMFGNMSLSHGGSLGIVNIKKRMKVEGAMSLYVQPMNGEVLEIVFDRKSPVIHKQFHEKYRLCNIGPLPKHLKIGKYCIEVKVVELFGPCINNNEYKYCFSNDEKLIAKVERLWVITH